MFVGLEKGYVKVEVYEGKTLVGLKGAQSMTERREEVESLVEVELGGGGVQSHEGGQGGIGGGEGGKGSVISQNKKFQKNGEYFSKNINRNKSLGLQHRIFFLNCS